MAVSARYGPGSAASTHRLVARQSGRLGPVGREMRTPVAGPSSSILCTDYEWAAPWAKARKLASSAHMDTV